MRIIVVSDIFGKTNELIALCDSLKLPVDIIDPYSSNLMHFKEESEAHDYFMNYEQTIKKLQPSRLPIIYRLALYKYRLT
jgi:hypothetical protein